MVGLAAPGHAPPVHCRRRAPGDGLARAGRARAPRAGHHPVPAAGPLPETVQGQDVAPASHTDRAGLWALVCALRRALRGHDLADRRDLLHRLAGAHQLRGQGRPAGPGALQLHRPIPALGAGDHCGRHVLGLRHLRPAHQLRQAQLEIWRSCRADPRDPLLLPHLEPHPGHLRPAGHRHLEEVRQRGGARGAVRRREQREAHASPLGQDGYGQGWLHQQEGAEAAAQGHRGADRLALGRAGAAGSSREPRCREQRPRLHQRLPLRGAEADGRLQDARHAQHRLPAEGAAALHHPAGEVQRRPARRTQRRP
mmetsp:Transcript_9721/g.22138  ORF Transcript_9721/g.22138 Transcript_9721/m.22138 type:complete len:311 (-) Transcript_9721:193-1125(-)